MRDTYLIFVNGEGTNNNKYYNMFPIGDTFRVEYGRVDATKTVLTYPSSAWKSTYNSKLKKGYKDITDFKLVDTVVTEASGNKDFDDFYSVFSRYTSSSVNKSYMVESATPAQLAEAQNILNTVLNLKDVKAINTQLTELYKVIPRRMGNVQDYLIKDLKQLDSVVSKEQDALDSMDSSSIMKTVNPYNELGLANFKEIDCPAELKQKIESTINTYGHGKKIHKVYSVVDQARTNMFNDWVANAKHKTCELLFHGTRNANVFSILKTGLYVRPTNAVTYSGSVYGDGLYHSAHTAKSMNYTGGDKDSIFFIQNVHMGNPYTYKGYYRDGKGLSNSQMNYNYLSKEGYDSLYVEPGDGLLNSEYIVYNKEQTNTEFIIHFK